MSQSKQQQQRNRSQPSQRRTAAALSSDTLVEQTKQTSQQLVEAVIETARQRPGATILWSLGIGFVLGWRLKPW